MLKPLSLRNQPLLMATQTISKARIALTGKQVGLKHGFRSGLEEALAAQLQAVGVSYTYESFAIPFVEPAKKRKYTPDFQLPNGIVIETKGRFLTADRQKHLMVQAQHPEYDIRFVFSSSRTKISKRSPTSYADWCVRNNFKFSDKTVPVSWIKESKP
jgi:hypothetical protein